MSPNVLDNKIAGTINLLMFANQSISTGSTAELSQTGKTHGLLCFFIAFIKYIEWCSIIPVNYLGNTSDCHLDYLKKAAKTLDTHLGSLLL